MFWSGEKSNGEKVVDSDRTQFGGKKGGNSFAERTKLGENYFPFWPNGTRLLVSRRVMDDSSLIRIGETDWVSSNQMIVINLLGEKRKRFFLRNVDSPKIREYFRGK